ncbi:leucine-rich repeat-containing G-protein coupled receptor 6-like [Amphibalanus amphitrite]|uniref:leucine-rich repeat-containing G-protein coupled receptor 6-like n=1 Tax=Amphibalanus amphitrite TaxID=1232801 RepID=UPI001C8FC2AA|nr:leucine-rich repeat-containing G-protein coupled receptor 6-like [Amphibalanus amphitrite]
MTAPSAALLTLLGLTGLLEPVWTRCPAQCHCESSGSDCSHSQLSAVPIFLDPRIHRLQLQGNDITSIADALMFYPSLRWLDLSNNSLTSLLEGQFVMQRDLLSLSVHDNRLGALFSETFSGLGRLQELLLDNNQIIALDDGVFQWMENLQRLDLSRNRIKIVTREAFEGLSALEWLDLSENNIGHVPSDAFRQLSALRTLKMRNNWLREVPFHAFYVLSSLQNLSLAENRLHRLHPEAFSGLSSLQRLDISGNLLDKFPATSLALPELEELDAGGNGFPSLQARHMSGMRRLRRLRVCGNAALSVVSPHAFSDSHLLEELHLCDNPQLTWFPSSAVEGLPRLRVLNLSGNSLGMLENMTSLLQRVETFNVSGNPLVCNCSSRWLWELPKRLPHMLALPPVRCVDSGRSLFSLSESELGCNSWLTPLLVSLAVFVVVFCAILVALLLLRRKRRHDRQRACVREAQAYADQWGDKWQVKWEDLEADDGLSGSHMFTHSGPEYGSLRRLEHFTFRSPEYQKKIPVTVV